MKEDVVKTNKKLDVIIWKKILKLVLKRPKTVIIAMVAMFFTAGLELLTPIVFSKALKVFFGNNPDYSRILEFAIYFIIIAICSMISIMIFIRNGIKIEVEIADDLRREAFSNLQKLSFTYYDKTPAGWIMARLTSDTKQLSDIISWGIIDLVWALTLSIGILITMFIYKWQLAIILLIATPILLFIILKLRQFMLNAHRKTRKMNSKITAAFSEGIMGSMTTKTLVLEEKQERDFLKDAINTKKAGIHATIKTNIIWPIFHVFSWLVIAIVIRFGVGMNIGEFSGITITVPTLYLFIQLSIFFFEPILSVSFQIAELQKGQAAAERILQLIEEKPIIVDREDVILKYGTANNQTEFYNEKIKGDISFENVSFWYNENEVVLNNFNLDIKKGTRVALVGPTGGGKSTIINLLCRFYEPKSGVIKIDGQDYKNISLDNLHQNLGYVLQTPYLFNDTVGANIKYGNLEASDDDIMEVIKQVNATSIIDKLENGLDTKVGSGGSRLSTGEKQLISFARALIRNPRIMILDEATSSVDTETESIIQHSTTNLFKDITTFAIAHRLSTIIDSDLILFIDGGKILEKGNHKQLLSIKGRYYNLYKNQFIDEKINTH